ISSLKSAFTDMLSPDMMKLHNEELTYNKTNIRSLLSQINTRLRYRWFIELDVDGHNDPFGFNTLKFPKNIRTNEPSAVLPFITYKPLNISSDSKYSPTFIADGKNRK